SRVRAAEVVLELVDEHVLLLLLLRRQRTGRDVPLDELRTGLRKRQRQRRDGHAGLAERLVREAAGSVKVRWLLGLARNAGAEHRAVIGLDRPNRLGSVAGLRNERMALVADDHVLRAGPELHVEHRRVRVAGSALAGEAHKPARRLLLERLAALAAVVVALVPE